MKKVRARSGLALLACLLLLGSVALAVHGMRQDRAAAGLHEQLRRSQIAAVSYLATVTEAETAQRGYLLTGDPAFLAHYEAARARYAAASQELSRMAWPDPRLAAQAGAALRAGQADMDLMARTIRMEQDGQADAAMALVRAGDEQRLMEALARDIQPVLASLTNRLAAKTEPAGGVGWALPALLGTAASLVFALLGLGQRRDRREAAASLAQLERFTRAFGLSQGLIRKLDGTITFWSAGTERLYGYQAAAAIGRSSHELLRTRFPEPLSAITAALRREGQWRGELIHTRQDGEAIAVASHWLLYRDIAANTEDVIEVNADVTALRQAENERERADALLHAVVEAAPGLIYAKDREGRLILANPPVMALVGKSWPEVAGRTDAELLADSAQAEIVMANDRRVMEAGEAQEVEEMIGGAGLRTRIWLSTKKPMRGLDNSVIGLVGVSMEITERKQAEERLLLVVHELNHRVKNTLATVQAIATQTLRGQEFTLAHTLEARLMALASAHDVLTGESWRGASLLEVVARVLAPHGGMENGRFEVAGPPIQLRPPAAVAIAMGLHELTTNALKYGALAGPGGCVAIHWRIEDESGAPIFHLDWTETGGPAVAPPTRRGFGTTLIERSLTQDLGGRATIEFSPAGVRCHVAAPLGEVATPTIAPDLPRVGLLHGLVA